MTVTPRPALVLDVLSTRLAILTLPPSTPIPEWTGNATAFLSVTRTPDELSIVADTAAVPTTRRPETRHVALRVRGPLALDLVGVVAALAAPLAVANIPIFPIATFDTDYLLVREQDLDATINALTAAGHHVATLVR